MAIFAGLALQSALKGAEVLTATVVNNYSTEACWQQ